MQESAKEAVKEAVKGKAGKIDIVTTVIDDPVPARYGKMLKIQPSAEHGHSVRLIWDICQSGIYTIKCFQGNLDAPIHTIITSQSSLFALSISNGAPWIIAVLKNSEPAQYGDVNQPDVHTANSKFRHSGTTDTSITIDAYEDNTKGNK